MKICPYEKKNGGVHFFGKSILQIEASEVFLWRKMFSKLDLQVLCYKIPISSYKNPFLIFLDPFGPFWDPWPLKICILDPFGPFGTLGPLMIRDLARLPGLLCLGSAELVLPCSLPCFALPRPPASLIREAALCATSTQGGGRLGQPPLFCGFLYEAC